MRLDRLPVAPHAGLHGLLHCSVQASRRESGDETQAHHDKAIKDRTLPNIGIVAKQVAHPQRA
jgi:hypothetical protein